MPNDKNIRSGIDLKEIPDILETTPALIYIYDLINNRNLYANREIFDYLGYTPEEIKEFGSELFQNIIHPDDLEQVLDFQKMLINADEDETYEIEYRMRSSEGKWIWFLSREKIFKRNNDGQNIQKAGIAIDISSNRYLSEKSKLREKILNNINKIYKIAITVDDEEDLLKECLNICQKITGADYGFIGEINPLGKFDTIALTDPGWKNCRIGKEDSVNMIKNMTIHGIWGRVIIEAKPLITNNPAEHPYSIGIPEGHPPLNNFLGVPMFHNEDVFGMIALGNKHDDFNEMDLEAVEKLSATIAEALRKKRLDQTIRLQSKEIVEVSTPTLQVWDGIIAMPLIGTLDSERTQQFMEKLLKGIINSNSEIAIIDITGVPNVDTQTAHHIMDSITAAGLLGAQVILTGVRPIIAQTLIHLGIDLSSFETQSSLAAGLEIAFEKLGLSIQKTK